MTTFFSPVFTPTLKFGFFAHQWLLSALISSSFAWPNSSLSHKGGSTLLILLQCHMSYIYLEEAPDSSHYSQVGDAVGRQFAQSYIKDRYWFWNLNVFLIGRVILSVSLFSQRGTPIYYSFGNGMENLKMKGQQCLSHYYPEKNVFCLAYFWGVGWQGEVDSIGRTVLRNSSLGLLSLWLWGGFQLQLHC